MALLSFQNIGLLPAQMRAVKKKAKDRGETASEYVRSIIERDLLADQTFDALLRPVRDDFRRSGTSETQLSEIVHRARRTTRRKPRRTRS